MLPSLSNLGKETDLSLPKLRRNNRSTPKKSTPPPQNNQPQPAVDYDQRVKAGLEKGRVMALANRFLDAVDNSIVPESEAIARTDNEFAKLVLQEAVERMKFRDVKRYLTYYESLIEKNVDNAAASFKYALDVVVNALKQKMNGQSKYNHSKLGEFNLEINEKNAWTLSFENETDGVTNSKQLLDYVYIVHKLM